jgi:hypothetical protein
VKLAILFQLVVSVRDGLKHFRSPVRDWVGSDSLIEARAVSIREADSGVDVFCSNKQKEKQMRVTLLI